VRFKKLVWILRKPFSQKERHCGAEVLGSDPILKYAVHSVQKTGISLIKEIKHPVGRRDKPLKVAVIVDPDGSHRLCLRSIAYWASVAIFPLPDKKATRPVGSLAQSQEPEGARSETRGGRRLGRQAAPQLVVSGEHADERLVRRRNQRPALCGGMHINALLYAGNNLDKAGRFLLRPSSIGRGLD
jgi:hypothetical protein